MDIHTKLMNALREERTIPQIKRSITLEREQLASDQRGLAHIVEQIAAVGDSEQTIQDWRVQMARLGRPSVLVPKHMLEDQRALQAHTQTREALMESISAREEKLGLLEAELEQARAAATDATWQIISKQADTVAAEMQKALTVYTDLARKLFALHQLSRHGKSEYFSQETQRLFAPLPIDAPRTAYLQAQGLDPFQYAAQIKPYVDKMREYRAALIENPDAPYPG